MIKLVGKNIKPRRHKEHEEKMINKEIFYSNFQYSKLLELISIDYFLILKTFVLFVPLWFVFFCGSVIKLANLHPQAAIN